MHKKLIQLAFNSLKTRSFRSWITIFGIIISVAVIFLLLTLSAGLQSAVVELFNDFGTNRIFILPGTGFTTGLASQSLSENIVEKIEKLDLFEIVIPGIYETAVKIEYKGQERRASVYGTPNTDINNVITAYKFDKNIIEGSFWNTGDRKVALLGFNVAKDNDAFFSKNISEKNSIIIKNEKYRVIGILKELGTDDDNTIQIPLEDAKELFAKTEYSYADALLKPNVDLTIAKERVDRLLEKELGEDNYVIMTPDGALRQFNTILSIVTALLGAIAAVSMIVGAVGIANTMFTAILEREKEIGIMKSTGAQNSHIMELFMLESGLIGAVGGAVGIVFGIIGAYIVQEIATQSGFALLSVSISPTYVVVCLIFAFIVGCLSGLLPSYLASKKRIVDILRDS